LYSIIPRAGQKGQNWESKILVTFNLGKERKSSSKTSPSQAGTPTVCVRREKKSGSKWTSKGRALQCSSEGKEKEMEDTIKTRDGRRAGD